MAANPAKRNRRPWGRIAVVAAALTMVMTSASTSQEILQKIEALVNDEVISAYDLQQRLGLVVAATGGVRNQEELLRLREQVLSSMVDEKLQLQEAAEFEVEVSQAEIDDAYIRVAVNFNQSPESFEGFLGQYGSSKNSLTSQLRAEFAWQTLVRVDWDRRYQSAMKRLRPTSSR